MTPDRERLMHLITIMERVRDEGRPLKMNAWFTLPRNGEPLCKTAACVLGYAAMDPMFQEMGLSIRVMQRAGSSKAWATGFEGRLGDWHPPGTKWSTTTIDVIFGENYGQDAAAEFFGISALDAGRLVSLSHYHEAPITPDHVIARIRDILGRSPEDDSNDD